MVVFFLSFFGRDSGVEFYESRRKDGKVIAETDQCISKGKLNTTLMQKKAVRLITSLV